MRVRCGGGGGIGRGGLIGSRCQKWRRQNGAGFRKILRPLPSLLGHGPRIQSQGGMAWSEGPWRPVIGWRIKLKDVGAESRCPGNVVESQLTHSKRSKNIKRCNLISTKTCSNAAALIHTHTHTRAHTPAQTHMHSYVCVYINTQIHMHSHAEKHAQCLSLSLHSLV